MFADHRAIRYRRITTVIVPTDGHNGCVQPGLNRPFVYPQDDIWVNVEERWTDIDREKPKDPEKKNLSQYH